MAPKVEVLPLVTANLPGCGGSIKAVPEDFEVDEVPAYDPIGEGEHLFLWVEKRGRSTPEVARALGVHFGLSEREVSYAGLKDRQAITRQLFCVPARVEPEASAFQSPEVKLLWWKRHRNKLKSGHLKANRFRIRLRSVKDFSAAQTVLARLEQTGAPNAFGDQRFGGSDDNAALGRSLLLGEKLKKKPDRFARKLYLSAFQSLLFNRALKARLEEGTFGRALRGDVLKKRETGGEFVCEDPAVDQPRVESFEVDPAGPMFGPKMTVAGGEVQRGELQLLADEGLTLEEFARGGGETEGARRAYRIRLGDPRIEPEGEDLWVSFTLPRGSYATVVLRELTERR